jgi:hypothetical protein
VATCPAGHPSADDQFCEVCGVLIGAAPSFVTGNAPAGAPATAQGPGIAGGAALPGEPCPRCGAQRAGNFCESCGYDFAVAGPDTLDPAVFRSAPPLPGPFPPPPPAPFPPPPPAPSSPPVPAAQPGPAPQAHAQPVPPPPAAGGEWTAVVTADRAYFDAVQADGGPDAAAIAFPAYVPQRRFRLAGDEVRIGRHSARSGIDPEIDLSVPPADPGVSRLHAVLLKSPDGTWSVVDPGSANGTAVNGSEIPQGQPVPLRDGDRIHLGAWTELRVVRGV